MLQQTASCSYSLPAARLGDRRSLLISQSRTCKFVCGCKSRSRHQRRTAIRVQAALEQGVFLSVLQQGAAFVLVSLGEGIYTRSQLKQNAKGRPSMLTLASSTLALAAALALLVQGQQKTGLAVGTVVSAALLLLDIKRAYDVEDNPREWPGPKAWPATLALISFFAVNVFGQALLRA